MPPTADIQSAFDPLSRCRRVIWFVDLDGHLANMIERDSNASVDPNGIWTHDAVISRPLQHQLARISRKVTVAGLTGGAAMRGRRLLSSVVRSNAKRMYVIGSEGAEVLRPGAARPELLDKYKSDAAKVTALTDRIAASVDGLGVQIERKGGVDLTIGSTFHFANMTDATRAGVIERLEPFVAMAKEAGLHAYLDTDANKNFSLGSKALSKRAGLVDGFRIIEAEQKVEFDGAMFGGDGTTDEFAFLGLDDLKALLAEEGRSLDTCKIAAMSNRTLSAKLANQSDLVVRGGDVTRAEAMEIPSQFDFEATGFGRADLGSVSQVMDAIALDFASTPAASRTTSLA